jgi:WD40 repeat protein
MVALAALTSEAKAVPPQLVEAVTRVASSFAAGGAPALSGLVAEPVAQLTREAMRTMGSSKLRLAAAVVLLAALCGLGTNWFTAPTHADPPAGPTTKGKPISDEWHEVWDIPGPAKDLRTLAFSPDGELLAISGETAMYDPVSGIDLIDMASGKLWHRMSMTGSSRSLAFSSDGRRLAAAGAKAGVRIFDMENVAEMAKGNRGNRALGVFSNAQDLDTPIADQVAFAPDGRLAVGLRDGAVEIWDVRTAKKTWTVRVLESGVGEPNTGGIGSFDPINHFAFSRDGRTLVTGGQKTICLCDTISRKITRVFDPKAITTWVDISPDGKRMSAVCNGSPRLWEIATGNWRRLGDDALPVIRPIVFSPDGKLLACGDANDWNVGPSKVRIFEGATGKPVVELSASTNGIWALAFSPDGKLLASADSNGRVKVWQRGSRSVRQNLVAGRLDQLVDQLIKNQRSDAQVTEGLFLAALGRLPTDAESKRALDEIARHKDRREGLAHVLEALTRTEEYAIHVADLNRRIR